VINKPRLGFSWKIPILKKRHIQQIAYQIQINQWDSRKILSNQTIHVPSYELESATYYQVRLRIWTTVSNQSSLWTNWI
jgi:hypothetical protein